MIVQLSLKAYGAAYKFALNSKLECETRATMPEELHEVNHAFSIVAREYLRAIRRAERSAWK